jgi:hypothetical protein
LFHTCNATDHHIAYAKTSQQWEVFLITGRLTVGSEAIIGVNCNQVKNRGIHMADHERSVGRAIPINVGAVQPIIHVRARLSHDAEGNLQVSKLNPEVESSEDAKIAASTVASGAVEKLSRYIGGDKSAWDEEVQQHYEIERERYLGGKES